MRKLKKFIFFLILACQVYSQCCLRFDGRNCIQCPEGTHLYRGNCLLDIKDCTAYQDGFDCAKCKPGFELSDSKDCIKIQPPQPVSNQASSQYIQMTINPKQLEGTSGDIYLICDDYLRTVKQQVKDASFKASKLKIFKNNTAEIAIQYQASKNIFFKAVLEFNLDTFMVKQISFTKTNELTINKPASATITKTEPLTLSNPTYSQKFSLVDEKIKKENSLVTNFKSGSVSTLSDGSFNFTLLYSSKNQGWDLQIGAEILKDKSIRVYQTKSIPVKLPTNSITSINKDNQNSATASTNSVPQTGTYQTLTNQDYTEQNYLICKDFLQAQSSDYNGLQPTKAKKSSSLPFIYFVLTYSKKDGSVVDISLKINTQTLLVVIEKSVMITQPTKLPTPAYVKIDSSQVFKDMNFIIVYDYIIKQSNSKYKDSTIRSVEKLENKTLISFRVYFQEGLYLWEVVATINLSNLITSGFSQKQQQILNKQNLNINSATNPVATPQKTKPANPNSSNSQPPKTIDTTVNQNPSVQTQQSQSLQPEPQTTLPSLKQQMTNLNLPATKPNQNTQSNISLPSSLPSPSGSLSISTVGNTGTTKPSQPEPPTVPTPTPSPNPPSTSPSPSGSSSIQVIERSAGGKTGQNYDYIKQRMGGLNEVSKSDQASTEFKQIDKTIRNSNSVELKNAQLIYAFAKQSGFTKNFQVYYESESGTAYEAVVSRDLLRKKTYIISFNKYGY